MNIYVIRALVLSILRKNAHLPLLIVLIPPILLSTTLLSLPSINSVVELLGLQDTSVVVVLDRLVLHNCYPAGIVEISISSSGFNTVALIVDHTVFDAISTTILARSVNSLIDEKFSASLPEDLYSRLGGPVKLELKVQDTFSNEVPVKYVHKLIDAPIIISAQNMLPQVYICITNKHSILRDMLLSIERGFFTYIRVWITFLTISYIPLVYMASKMVVKRVSSELRVFINLGLDPSRLSFYASLSMLAVTFLLAILLYSIAIVILYTTYSFISTIVPFISPQPGIHGISLTLLFSISCYPLFYISARRLITLEK